MLNSQANQASPSIFNQGTVRRQKCYHLFTLSLRWGSVSSVKLNLQN